MQDGGEFRDETALSVQRLLELVTGGWRAQSLHAAAELRIADLLAGGPLTGDELAAATGTDASALGRLLRALTTIDVCRQDEDGRFEITPLGSLLGTDVPESMRSWTIWWGRYLWPVWGQLLYSVRTGQSARTLLLGTKGFEHLVRDPEAAAVFNRAAAEMTRLTAAGVVGAYDFSGLARIVDVGGGSGELLASILGSAPAARGTLFDLPHAIEHGRRRLAEAGLAARCELVSGDFFVSVPSGGEAYVLKSVIHDWNDELARRILENCRRAMDGSGQLLLVEVILPERLTTSLEHQALARDDLNMLVALDAKERTEVDFRRLLSSAGFRVTRIAPAGMSLSIIEAVPEPSTSSP